MTPDDLPLVGRWQELPHVRAWWGDPEENGLDEDDLADPNVRPWIVSFEGRPFAYLQDYDPHAWPGHHFEHLLPGSRGIDQFIGEPDMLGAGHGSAFIGAHVRALIAAGAPAVATDPHPENGRAIRAYEKAGFVRGEVRRTVWGLCLLMVRSAER